MWGSCSLTQQVLCGLRHAGRKQQGGWWSCSATCKSLWSGVALGLGQVNQQHRQLQNLALLMQHFQHILFASLPCLSAALLAAGACASNMVCMLPCCGFSFMLHRQGGGMVSHPIA